MITGVRILWSRTVEAKISLKNNGVLDLKSASLGSVDNIDFEVTDAQTGYGPFPTIVKVESDAGSFSFLVRDVSLEFPIYIPEYSVIVTTPHETRSFGEIASGSSGCCISEYERIQNDKEESFEMAKDTTREMPGMAYLGLARDVRIFEAGFHGVPRTSIMLDFVKPMYHRLSRKLNSDRAFPIQYDYLIGRGNGCSIPVDRELKDGYLPVYITKIEDSGISYTSTMFADRIKSFPDKDNGIGTHYLVADKYCLDTVHHTSACELQDSLLKTEFTPEEMPVVLMKITAENSAKSPKYCHMMIPRPKGRFAHAYDSETGFGSLQDDEIYLIAYLNDHPVPASEMTVMLRPGESLEYVFILFHSPVSTSLAKKAGNLDFETELASCKEYWNSKLSRTAQITLPEKRVENMLKAGYLHLDMFTYGKEPDGPLAATVGIYPPIGTESAPIIQFYNSIGAHGEARRSLQYFYEKQHEDGQLQNFSKYSVETAAVLWTTGCYYLYTHDDVFIREISPKIEAACRYIIDWRSRNKKPELVNYGYGMLDGSVADPDDTSHLYMLNAYAYQGLLKASLLMDAIGEVTLSGVYKKEAEELKDCIVQSVHQGLADSPVVPLGDGKWGPMLSPWAGKDAPLDLHLEGESSYTHGSTNVRDSLIGAIYLPFMDVIDANSLESDFIIRSFTEHFYMNNVAFSQPYYSPHPFLNLMRNEIRLFLKEFYNGFSSLADRDIYFFWEHYFNLSAHKTHEEAWFLMRARWLLYYEYNDVLNILQGVPRSWLEDGKVIEVNGASSYFGMLSFRVESDISEGSIRFDFLLKPGRCPMPAVIRVRLPHPESIKARYWTSGEYDIETESVVISKPEEMIHLEIKF